MTYEDFRQTVIRLIDEIPKKYLKDLQGVHVFEFAKFDPNEPQLVRLGEYLDPGPYNFLGSSGGLGRHVALYYGSFCAIAYNRPNFDWEEQIWETLTHEIQHHLESKAGEITLIEKDREFMDNFRRNKYLN